jgi:hypothetical protein
VQDAPAFAPLEQPTSSASDEAALFELHPATLYAVRLDAIIQRQRTNASQSDWYANVGLAKIGRLRVLDYLQGWIDEPPRGRPRSRFGRRGDA